MGPLLISLLSLTMLAEHPYSTAALMHDKIMLLHTYEEPLQSIDATLISLAQPYDVTMTATNLLASASSSTHRQLTETAHSIQKKLITLSWLASELHESTPESQTVSHLLTHAQFRADNILTRITTSQRMLATMRKKLTQSNQDLQDSIRHLQACYYDVMLQRTLISSLVHNQITQQNNLMRYEHSLLNLNYGHPLIGRPTITTKRLTPFSYFVPSPASGTIVASQHFPGLGSGVVIFHHGHYTLVTGLDAADVTPGSAVTTGMILGKLHDDASDVLVASWQKQDTE